MPIKVDSKIVDFAVLAASPAPSQQAPVEPQPERMHERVSRPELLEGRTYKIKTPLSEHALYVTINDMVLNAGSPHEARHPFEIFINSKNMDHFQWIVALTRIVSAVFRKGGDCTFLVEELQSVFDPSGGYFKPGGRFMPSLVAEIGVIIERHLESLGMLERDADPHREAYLTEKRAELAGRETCAEAGESSQFPPDAMLCSKCYTRATVLLDGCRTCLNCGESKCG